jgi:hypothetical protein
MPFSPRRRPAALGVASGANSSCLQSFHLQQSITPFHPSAPAARPITLPEPAANSKARAEARATAAGPDHFRGGRRNLAPMEVPMMLHALALAFRSAIEDD